MRRSRLQEVVDLAFDRQVRDASSEPVRPGVQRHLFLADFRVFVAFGGRIQARQHFVFAEFRERAGWHRRRGRSEASRDVDPDVSNRSSGEVRHRVGIATRGVDLEVGDAVRHVSGSLGEALFFGFFEGRFFGDHIRDERRGQDFEFFAATFFELRLAVRRDERFDPERGLGRRGRKHGDQNNAEQRKQRNANVRPHPDLPIEPTHVSLPL